jgi:protein TonB
VPQYPREAMVAAIQGAVSVEVVINEAGQVTDAKVVRSVPLLDEAALKAVREWRFAPTLVNGQPVAVRNTLMVNFSLSGNR